jgi:hypothetical protein
LYRSKFDEICEKKYGRRFNFPKVEKKLREVGEGERPLEPKDIEVVFDASATPFSDYSVADVKKMADSLRGRKIWLGKERQPRTEDLLQTMLKVCKSIFTVSLILRFARPRDFGIYSSPVQYLVQVYSPTTVGLYVAYCDELKNWQRHFGLPSVADTEMAIWAYQQVASGVFGPKEANRAHRELTDDLWIQQRRAERGLGPLLKRREFLRVAEILLTADPILAGMIARKELERALKQISSRERNKPLVLGQEKVSDFLEELTRGSPAIITRAEQEALRRAWSVGSRCVHEEGAVAYMEVERIIKDIRMVCSKWMP